MSDIPQLSSKLHTVSLGSSRVENCSLANLPFDVITHDLIPQFATTPVLLEPANQVTQVRPSSKPLRQLAATSKHFRSLISGQYKTYLQHQYPSVYTHAIQQASASGASLDSINWSNLVAYSEKLCYRWDRRQLYISVVSVVDKAGIVHPVKPKTMGRNHHNHHHHAKKEAAYSPCIDASESPNGTETLVIGQGTELAVREGEYSPWRVVTRKGMAPGVDDILGVHIYDSDTIITSRSSSVEIVRKESEDLRILQAMDMFPSGIKNPTGGITSSCIDTASPRPQSFAITSSIASPEKHELMVFSIETGSSTPVYLKTSLTSAIPSKPWTSMFLTPTTICTGHRSGITLHQLTESSFSDPVTIPQPPTHYTHDIGVHSLCRLSSPLSPSLIASGWADGVTRILDTRTNTYVATYENTVSGDTVPIYSLLHTSPLGNTLLAGSSTHHALAMHDLRYSSSMVLQNSPYMLHPRSLPPGQKLEDVVSSSALLFFDSLQPRNSAGISAIFSLASPSPTSGKVYMGIENNVVQMDFKKRKVGKNWGWGLTKAERARKREAEKKEFVTVPLYWFDPEKQRGCERGGRWRVGMGNEPWVLEQWSNS